MTNITHPAKQSGFIAAIAAQPFINDIVSNLYKKYDHIEDYLWADSSCQQLIKIKDREHFWNHVQNNLYFAQRAQLEKNFNFRQLLPYVLVVREVEVSAQYPLGVQVLSYARLQGGGESRLHGKSSVGFGGHIDLVDAVYDDHDEDDPTAGGNRPNILDTIEHSAYREVFNEELKITFPAGGDDEEDAANIDFNDLVLLETQEETGRVHLGLVHTLRLKAGTEITSPEAKQIELTGWSSFTELKNSGREFEGWSKALIEYYAEKESQVEGLDGDKYSDVHPKELT